MIATARFSPYGSRLGGIGRPRVWIEMYMRLRSLVISLYNALFARAVEKLFFHQLVTKTNNFGKSNWLGKPIWQNTFDLWIAQETIHDLKPSLIIECGTNRGGSAYFYAQLFDLMDTDGRVVSVDIEKLHDLSHPRVTYLIGSSVSDEIAGEIRAMAEAASGPVLVILDSDHSEAHVAKELELYAPLTTVGSYCLVQDGIIDELFMFRKGRPGPLPALEKYLARHPEFEIDHERCERFLITHHPKGWLKRVR
ncbi:MAG: CmcI family methyltransferase [Verrucomicrobiota bacterium]|nr:CmcI family methyltransferase [Verrucomicrobiota bacterium]